MNTKSVPEEFRFVAKAVVERMWSYTVAITNCALVTHGRDPATGLPATEEEAPGTGFAGVWGKHHFILTAKHVVDRAVPNDLTFFVRQTGELGSQHASEVTMQDAFRPVPLTDKRAVIHRCKWDDLALLRIKSDALGPNLEFFAIPSSCVDPLEGESVFGLAYPVASSVIFKKQVGTVLQNAVLLSPTPMSGVVMPSTSGKSLKGFAPARHYLISYEPAKRGKHPKGISGAAVWIVSTEESVLWAARLKFAGTCTSCYKDGTVEQIVKASRVVRFLTQVFGHSAK